MFRFFVLHERRELLCDILRIIIGVAMAIERLIALCIVELLIVSSTKIYMIAISILFATMAASHVR